MTTVPLDLAVRGTYNTLIGSTEIDLKTIGLDVIVSRVLDWRVMNVAPNAYSPIWCTLSNVIDSTPGTRDNADGFVFATRPKWFTNHWAYVLSWGCSIDA